jgi:hypothetical protein
MEQNSYMPQVALPNSGTILALGIVSIVLCLCYIVPGIICAIAALVMAKPATALYIYNPGQYTVSSFQSVNTGKICAWITLALSILFIMAIAIAIAICGWVLFSDPAHIINELMEV